MNERISELKAMMMTRRNVERSIVEAIPAAFPIGSHATYPHGSYRRLVLVVEHNQHFPSLRVEGSSGTKYWIDVYWLLK